MYENLIQVERLVEETKRKLGLFQYIEVEFRKFRSRGGDASVIPSPKVRFSSILWPLATDEQRRQIVVHEVCHIKVMLEDLVRGHRIEGPHGPSWAAAMRSCGEKPDTRHKIQGPPLKTFGVFTCGCENRTHSLTKHRWGKVIKGCRYICSGCKKNLVPSEETAKKLGWRKCS